jgi:hypothetical protein
MAGHGGRGISHFAEPACRRQAPFEMTWLWLGQKTRIEQGGRQEIQNAGGSRDSYDEN